MTMKHTVFEKVTSGSLQSTGKNINHIYYSGTRYIAFVKEHNYSYANSNDCFVFTQLTAPTAKSYDIL